MTIEILDDLWCGGERRCDVKPVDRHWRCSGGLLEVEVDRMACNANRNWCLLSRADIQPETEMLQKPGLSRAESKGGERTRGCLSVLVARPLLQSQRTWYMLLVKRRVQVVLLGFILD